MDSIDVIKESMKEVIQELVVIDKNGQHHLVYIMNISYNHDKGLEVDFNSPSGVTDELSELVNKAIQAQITAQLRSLSKWEMFKLWLSKW